MQNCCRSAVPVSFDVDSADIWKRIMGKLEVLEVYLGTRNLEVEMEMSKCDEH